MESEAKMGESNLEGMVNKFEVRGIKDHCDDFNSSSTATSEDESQYSNGEQQGNAKEREQETISESLDRPNFLDTLSSLCPQYGQTNDTSFIRECLETLQGQYSERFLTFFKAALTGVEANNSNRKPSTLPQDTSTCPTPKSIERIGGATSVEKSLVKPIKSRCLIAQELVYSSEGEGNRGRQGSSGDENGDGKAKKQRAMKYTCEHCGKLFSNNCDRVRHERSHTGDKPYECPQCKKKFSRQFSLDVHLRMHTGLTPYVCSLCDKKFGRASRLAHHLRVHNGEKRFECEVCGKKFLQYAHCVEHTRTHTGEKPFVCKVCGKQFSRSTHLKTHSVTHNEKYQDRLKVQSEFSLRKPSRNKCTVCGRNFPTRETLDIHIKRHADTQKHKCPHCDKSFSRESMYKVHLKTHLDNDKSLSCGFCGKTYTVIANLTEHVASHTKETRYVCDVCGKGFTRSSSLGRHVRSHSGLRYECQECGKSYTQPANLARHVIKHREEALHEQSELTT